MHPPIYEQPWIGLRSTSDGPHNWQIDKKLLIGLKATMKIIKYCAVVPKVNNSQFRMAMFDVILVHFLLMFSQYHEQLFMFLF